MKKDTFRNLQSSKVYEKAHNFVHNSITLWDIQFFFWKYYLYKTIYII